MLYQASAKKGAHAIYPQERGATNRLERMAGKSGRRALALAVPAFLALLFAHCAPLDPPRPFYQSLHPDLVGCFCRDPEERHRSFICIVPEGEERELAHGTGRGLLRGTTSLDAWDFSGAGERQRVLAITVWREEALSAQYDAILEWGDETLVLRESYGTWSSDLLNRCGG